MEPSTLAELVVRYDALRLSNEDECMTMMLAAACQLATRNDCHPGAILVRAGEQTKDLWGERWGVFIRQMLETGEDDGLPA